jgi:hypothetical protein
MVGQAKILVRQGVQDALAAGRGERQGALASDNGLVLRPPEVEMD